MAMRGRPTAELSLTDDERETLERWSRRRKTAQALALRARIVMQCAAGHTNRRVAAYQGVTVQTVGKWRKRFVHAQARWACRRAPFWGPAHSR